jgi:hypothetical protein
MAQDGSSCRILADSLGVGEFFPNSQVPGYGVAIASTGFLEEDDYEFHTNSYETMEVRDAQVLLCKYDAGGVCGFAKEVGRGKVVVISVGYKCYLISMRKSRNSWERIST